MLLALQSKSEGNDAGPNLASNLCPWTIIWRAVLQCIGAGNVIESGIRSLKALEGGVRLQAQCMARSCIANPCNK